MEGESDPTQSKLFIDKCTRHTILPVQSYRF